MPGGQCVNGGLAAGPERRLLKLDREHAQIRNVCTVSWSVPCSWIAICDLDVPPPDAAPTNAAPTIESRVGGVAPPGMPPGVVGDLLLRGQGFVRNRCSSRLPGPVGKSLASRALRG